MVRAPSGLQVASCGKDVDIGTAALLTVQHGRPGKVVGFESRPRRLLEGVENRADLFVGRLIPRCTRDPHRTCTCARREAVLDSAATWRRSFLSTSTA